LFLHALPRNPFVFQPLPFLVLLLLG
jgi:hypothetical protein